MKTRNWNKENGQNLKREMDAAKLTNKALAQVVDVTPRTIKNWKAGEGGPKDHQRRSIEDLLSRLPGLHSKSHPHQFLFSRLRQAVSAGIKYEVVGLPGMLKSKVLQELRSSLSDDGHAVLLVETRNENDIQGFWNSLGQCLIKKRKNPFKFEDVERAIAKSKFTLLLDDADVFLWNVQDGCLKSGCEFRPLGSQWIKQVQSLKSSVIMTSTISTADFVAVASGRPSPFSFIELECKSWYQTAEWNSWTAGIANGQPLLAVDRIRSSSEGIPLVFIESIEILKAHGDGDVHDMIRELHSHIANSIWNRLPIGMGKELIAKLKESKEVVEESEETRLTRALSKSGILVEHGKLRRLRAKDWLATWKREAKITS